MRTFRKTYFIISVILFCFIFCLQIFAGTETNTDTNANIQAKDEDKTPWFTKPVALLVGLNSSELTYNEISLLSGFEFVVAPYRSDVKTLVEKVNPTQVIIKHPSGFVGLYSCEGQLIRGVKTFNYNEATLFPGSFPPSVIQPYEANSAYPSLIYSGSLTGTVPHGGLGYKPPPKGRGALRHLLKLATFTGLVPFQYPGYFNAYSTTDQEKLFPSLILPQVPIAIGAAATFYDSKLDETQYEYARSQPRDYGFQPVIENY